MATMTSTNPISDLMYDWLTVLHNKAEGLAAYEKYIKDAREAGSDECVEMFRRLHEHDARMVQEIKDHVFGMIRDGHEAVRS
jgi:methylase of polypeptide subunit release factors